MGSFDSSVKYEKKKLSDCRSFSDLKPWPAAGHFSHIAFLNTSAVAPRAALKEIAHGYRSLFFCSPSDLQLTLTNKGKGISVGEDDCVTSQLGTILDDFVFGTPSCGVSASNQSGFLRSSCLFAKFSVQTTGKYWETSSCVPWLKKIILFPSLWKSIKLYKWQFCFISCLRYSHDLMSTTTFIQLFIHVFDIFSKLSKKIIRKFRCIKKN